MSLINTFEELMGTLMPEIDYDGATLIDTHQYTKDNVHYKQKVYRLKDNTIAVEVENLASSRNLRILRSKLNNAVREQNFELAAELRDKIKELDVKN